MRKAPRIALQCLIGVFFFWHAAVIGIYAIPISAQHPIARPLRDWTVRNVSAPYVLLLSQWQQWNLFSPDPLRRVSRYRIETQTAPDTWKPLASIVPGSYEWWRHATHHKLFIGMLEKDQDTYNAAVVRHLLLSYCAPHRLAPATPVRVVYTHYIVSRPETALDALRPDPWPPIFDLQYGEIAYCP
jgi:hypothetical protein